MTDLKVGESDLLHTFRPDTWWGAIIYLALFVTAALLFSRGVRSAVHAAMTRGGHLDRTTINFLQQVASALIWVIMIILYAHLIPVLRTMGTALLAGASVASVVIGLAAQSTLGNLVAGVSITIYRPFQLGDALQVTAPTGTEAGIVESISLGYTTLRAPDGRMVVLPNSLAASQVLINLNSTFAPGQMSIAIRVSRDADLQAAQNLAVKVATEEVGEKAVNGCFLTKMDSSAAILELRVQAPDLAHRDSLRSMLVARLAQHFSQFALPAPGTERPSFA